MTSIRWRRRSIADFFVWFKYGDDDAADVVFTNISDPQTPTIDEMRSTEVDGLKYKVFPRDGDVYLL
ncbi:MAG: hypothetical protein R2848_02760 [Thermomicrobiales bacterium]